ALPRPPGICTPVVPPRACAQSALLDPLGPGCDTVRSVRRALLLVAALAALAVPVAAIAHPLGNFTINRYSELDVAGNRLYVLYVLDMAEIPTFQAQQAGGVDAAAYARRIASHLRLTVSGKSARLVPVEHVLAFPPG